MLIYNRMNCASVRHSEVSDFECGEIQREVFRVVWYLEGLAATFTKVGTVALSTLDQ
jgi:hypothetical protein